MKLNGMLPFRTAVCGLALMAVSVKGASLFQEYCSSENTGAGFGAVYNSYQSLGSCQTLCANDNYAFGIVQYTDCWCSNYIPAEQSSVSACNVPCPGYPYELCGNKDDGLFGYIPLNKKPLGTAGAAPSTKTTKSPLPKPSPSNDVSPTVTRTVTQVQSPRISVVVSYVTSTPSSSSSSKVSTTKSTVMTKVSTVSGTPVTHTITSTSVGIAPGHNSDRPSVERQGLSDGAIAGIVIGALLGVAVIAVAAFLLWRRRKSSNVEGRSSGSPKRKGSVLSRTGLLGAARPQSMAENNNDDTYYAEPTTRTNSFRHSMMFGARSTTGEDAAPVSPIGSSQDTGSERRTSRPLVYDQRLNPSALFAHHDNSSRVSMQDQQDYSRPLGLANPEFARTYSFDSR